MGAKSRAGSVDSGGVDEEELMEKVHYLTRGTRDPGGVPTSTRSRSIFFHITVLPPIKKLQLFQLILLSPKYHMWFSGTMEHQQLHISS